MEKKNQMGRPTVRITVGQQKRPFSSIRPTPFHDIAILRILQKEEDKNKKNPRSFSDKDYISR